MGLSRLQRYTADPHPTLVAHHGRHERPAVSLGVVHLHRVQVGLPVVAAHCVEVAAIGYQGDAAATRVHGHQVAPLVRHRAVHLRAHQEARAVVAAHHVQLAAQGRRAVPTALVHHGRHRVPQRCVLVVVLHLVEERSMHMVSTNNTDSRHQHFVSGSSGKDVSDCERRLLSTDSVQTLVLISNTVEALDYSPSNMV